VHGVHHGDVSRETVRELTVKSVWDWPLQGVKLQGMADAMRNGLL
jgi:hypothetical protein